MRKKATPKKYVPKTPTKAPKPRKVSAPRKKPIKKQVAKLPEGTGVDPPVSELQPYIQSLMERKANEGNRKSVFDLSGNEIQPNPLPNKKTKKEKYNNMQGLKGSDYDFAAPIKRKQPIGVYSFGQLLLDARNNEFPDEFGVKNKNKLPSQEIIPTRGGKYSGRTGPLR